MKQLYFIKWCAKSIWTNIKSWDHWMWAWVITCAWGPSAVMSEVPATRHLFVMFVLTFWIGYGLIYTSIKRAYQKFQEEQERIINHLKDVG